MSEISITEAVNKQQQKLFIHFPVWLYEANRFYSPPTKEIDDFAPHNTVNQGTYSKTLLAVSSDTALPNHKTIVGRIAVFINSKTNEARFSHLDFIDNSAVCEKLMHAAEAYAQEGKAKILRGPLSFKTNCYHGLLVNGFDKPAKPPYNYAYYKGHLEELGYIKDETIELKDPNRRCYCKAIAPQVI